MINMLIRSIIIYLFVFVAVRLMGKRQIGEMQPFELVITLIIADLACIPMAEMAVPLSHGIIPILTLVVLHYFICLFSRKSTFVRHLFCGRPAIVVSPKGINYEELKRLNMNIDDLVEGMRGCDIFNFDEIAYAVIETNGKMAILPKKAYSPATCADVGVTKPKSALPIAIIMDGKLQSENIQLAQISTQFVWDCLKKAKVSKIKNVILMTLDNNGKVFLQPHNKSYVTLDTNFDGGERW